MTAITRVSSIGLPMRPYGPFGPTIVAVDATVGTLVISDYAATISVGISLAATCDTLEVTGLAASVDLGMVVYATCDTVAIASYAATISTGVSLTATCDTLVVTGLAAVVDISLTVAATANSALVISSSYPVTIIAGTPVLVTHSRLQIASYPARVTPCTFAFNWARVRSTLWTRATLNSTELTTALQERLP